MITVNGVQFVPAPRRLGERDVVRAHGVRRSASDGGQNTFASIFLLAVACNVKRFIRHGFCTGTLCPVTAVMTPSAAAVSAAQMAFSSFFSSCFITHLCLLVGNRLILVFKTKTTVSASFSILGFF